MTPRLADPAWLLALWALPPAGLLVAWLLWRKRVLLRRLVEARLAPAMAPGFSLARQAIKHAGVLASLALVVVALARPQWGVEEREVPRVGRDVVFLIDVSRSMLAQDLRPSRLERVKLWVGDAIKSLAGDRVAIVAFAGSTVVKCPLTLDHGFARLALRELTPDSVARGGTNLGDAIRLTAREVFDLDGDDAPPEARRRDVILISDGGDQESLPIEAAAAVGRQGVRIIAVGVGDDAVPRPIPIEGRRGPRFLVHQGERVLTKLERGVLERVALASNAGAYLHVATGTVELDQVYNELARDAERQEFEAVQGERYREQFQWFLLAAALLLAAEPWLSERKGGRRPQ